MKTLNTTPNKFSVSPKNKEKVLNVVFGLLLTLTLIVLAGIPALEQVKIANSITANKNIENPK